MITTNNSIFCERLRRLRTHGITKDPDLLEENHGDWYYEMQEHCYNYRMTDIQAALGNSQLSRAENNLLLRRKIAEKYNQAFSDHPKIVTPAVNDNIYHAYHLYVILTDNRDKLFMYLRKNNIMVQVHYIPLHLQPYYRTNFGFKKGDFPIAENYYQKAISLPMYPSLSEEQQSYVIDKILEFYKTN
jgi:dTDP-4-amino-4,6-dideoxygalactose transaminase